MKSLLKTIKIAAVLPALLLAVSCGPNDDKGGMDTDNSAGEGSLDSSRQTPSEGGRVDSLN